MSFSWSYKLKAAVLSCELKHRQAEYGKSSLMMGSLRTVMSYLQNSMMYWFNRKWIHSILRGIYCVQSIVTVVVGSVMQFTAVKFPVRVRSILG